jgi:hypothetical protein
MAPVSGPSEGGDVFDQFDARNRLEGLSPVFSPDFEAYASGQLDASRARCALCEKAPCECPEFGTPEYLALIDHVHGHDKTNPTDTKPGSKRTGEEKR